MVTARQSRPPEGEAVPSTARRLGWMVVALAVGFLVLGLLADGVRGLLARTALPTGTAEWIWAEVPASRSRGLAFYAVRDVDLGETPPAVARLLISAEEEYLVWVNGRFVGSGIHRPGAPLDAYQVEDFLLPGGNRVVVLARSVRGQGGLLAALVPGVPDTSVGEVPDTSVEWGKPLLVTDGSWQIVRHERTGLVEGWLPVVRRESRGGEVWPPEAWPGMVARPPRVWGLPPVGRWGWPRAPDTAAEPASDRQAARARTLWGPGEEPSRRVRFALERPVEGVLVLRFVPPDPADPDVRPGAPPAALVALGDDTPGTPHLASGGPATALAVTPEDTDAWRDSVARRFAEVEISSSRPVVAVEVVPRPAGSDGEERRPLGLGEERPGLFGIRTLPSRPPLEKELRRQLQEVAGGGGR